MGHQSAFGSEQGNVASGSRAAQQIARQPQIHASILVPVCVCDMGLCSFS